MTCPFTPWRIRGGVLVLLLGLLSLEAKAGFDITDVPPFPSASRPRFIVNSANYMNEGRPEVVLSFRIPYGELFFEEKADRNGATFYEAEFNLVMLLYDGNRQVGGDLWEESVRVDDEKETKSRQEEFRKVVRIPVEPGRLRAEVSVRERQSGRGSGTTWELEVPNYAREKLGVSSLWVAECEPDDDSAIDLPPNRWVLDHSFGEPLDKLCIVGEVYRRETDSPVNLTWRVLDARRDELFRDSAVWQGGTRVPFRIRPDLSSLYLGSYIFEIEVENSGDEARRRFEFQMDETMVSLANDMEQSIDLIRLIANQEEVRKLEAAPEAQRAEAWAAFWRDRDPTPGTPDNEFKDSFFSRVRHANEAFGILEPGWKSDRGRIFIKYGAADEVESRPSRLDGLAVEVWIYLELGLRFVFIDYDGFGRYELYQPGRS